MNFKNENNLYKFQDFFSHFFNVYKKDKLNWSQQDLTILFSVFIFLKMQKSIT